jgi:putative flippase GtrA
MISYPYQLCKDLLALKQSATRRGWAEALREVLRPDSSSSWQFTKYLFIGGSSVLVFYAAYGLFRLIVEFLMPGAFTNQRMLWNLLGIFVAFVPTNSFTYQTNRRWVFVDGKHSLRKEFMLFTAGAALSFVVCQFVAGALMYYSALNDFIVTLAVIAVSTLVNFLFRKFVVFHS